jgi:iron complex outermembrane receptor protein
MKQDITRPTNIGPASSGSSNLVLSYDRDVSSAFAEVLIPIVGPDNAIPVVASLELNVSGRYDDYSDFGSTTNPRYALDWSPIRGLKFRGNYAQSFVAPALTSRGNEFGITGESSFGNSGFGQINVPLSAYPEAAGLPGCSASAATCAIGTAAIPGIQLSGGNEELHPQEGETWSVGAEINPTFAPNLRIGVTWWHSKVMGAITAPTPAFAVNAAGLNSLLTIYPTGASAAQIAQATAGLPQLNAIAPVNYFIYNFQQRNALNLEVNGIDADVNYRIDTGVGSFDLGAAFSKKLDFDQQVGTGGAVFSVLDSSGFNTTFPSIEFTGRANVGWTFGSVSTVLFVNYTDAYRNWSATTATPLVRSALGVPVGGGDEVDAYTTVDLNVSYSFKEGALQGTQVFFDATNVLDEDPPFFNTAIGYDTFSASPIGRVVTLGARVKF